MLNPDKYIRKGCVAALSITGVPITEAFPVSDENPAKYIILTSQSKQPTAQNKDDYEWLCQLQLDVNVVQSKGFTSSLVADDLEEQCHNAITENLRVDNFAVKDVRLVDSLNLDVETPYGHVKRKRIIYQLWLCQV